MPFTPSEIKNKRIYTSKKWFRTYRVANYLEQLSNEIERLKRR